MSPKAFYASTHRMPFSETSTQNKGLFGTPGVKGSLLSLRSIPYAYTWCRHPSSQHTKCPVTIFSKQFGESLEHWTDSSVAVALKGRSHMFAIFSQALSWSEATFRRDVPSTPWSFPPSWPLLTSFHCWPWRRWPLGPSNGHIMLHILTGKTLTVSYSQWISQHHTLMAFAGHGMAILDFFSACVTAFR